MRELAQLGMHIWRTYPDFYAIYSEPDFTWNKITQRNRNPLLAMKIGADGMKTGFTEASGYAIVGSAERAGTRVFLAMSGMASDQERADEARKLLEWGMVGFSRTPLFGADETVGSVAVYGGDKTTVALRAKGPIAIPLPRSADERLVARIVYQGPIAAPIKQGDQIGSLKVWLGETLTQETPLYAAADVSTGSFHQRAWAAVRELAVGWLR